MSIDLIISIIFGLIGLFFSIYFYLKSRKYKKLSYLIENDTIFNEKINVDRLTVSYNNQRLSGFSIAKLLIVNDGKEVIEESDISKKEPLRILLTDHKILDVNVLHSGDNKIEINKISDNSFSIHFEFLNPKEGIIIKFLHDGAPFEKIKLGARIKSVNNITNLNSGTLLDSWWFPSTLILVPTSFFFLVIASYKNVINSMNISRYILFPTLLILFIAVFLGYLFVVSFLFSSKHIDELKDKMSKL